MRKIPALFLALILLCTSALAFEGNGYPAWDGASQPANAACGSFDGQSLLLEFDAAPEYSLVAGGIAQLCFFAHDSDRSHYLELYLMLPANVQPGDVLTQETLLMEGCSVTLYEVLPNGEDCYYAAQFLGMAYPEGSSFELRIDSAESAADRLSLSGSLSAVLCRMQGDFATGESIRLDHIAFDCSLPLTGASPFAGNTEGANPFSAAPDPVPNFTLPPDYIRL